MERLVVILVKGLYGLASRRQLVNDAHVEVAVYGHGECARYGRGCHDQHMRRLVTLSPQLGTLCHAKAVLLVDDGESEVGKLYRVFDDGMCADKNFHVAAHQTFEHLAAALALDDAREQFHAYWHVAEKVANGGEVLLCQDLRGCHDAGLIAVQMISYEMSLGLCLISAVVLTGTMQVSGIVEAQTGPWNWLIIKGHVPAILAFLVFLVAGNAEANRGPFDLAEAESELTAGYHTEYSGMGFGFYYLAEYLNLFVISGIASTVFLGGWAPINIGVEAFDAVMNLIPGIVWFLGKTFAIVWILMWIRWTFPRLRIDQILKLEWKYLMPLCLINLILMTVVVAFGWHF